MQNDADFFLDCCSSKEKNEEGKTPPEAYQDSEAYHELQERLEQGIVPRRELPSVPWYRKLLPCFDTSVPLEAPSGQGQQGRMESDSDSDEQPSSMDSQITELEPQPPQYDGRYARGPVTQWFYLVTRNARTWWRSPLPLCIMIMNATMFGLILGLLFLHMDNSQTGAREHLSIFFFIALVMTTSVMTYIPQLFAERAALYRETSAKSYPAAVYLLAMISVTLPLLFMYAMIVVIPAWAIAGLAREAYKIGYMWGGAVCLSIISYGFLLFLSCLAPVPELGQSLFTIINILNAMTNGFLLLRTRIPPWWIWFYWIGYQHYALEGLLLNELQRQDFYCEPDELLPIPVPSDTDPLRVQTFCQFRTGEDVLESVKAHMNLKLVDIIVLGGFIALLFSLSLIVITKVRHIKR